MSSSAIGPADQPELSGHGLFVILASTALALLATPLASPAMPEIARIFAEQAQTESFARMVLASISFLPGEPNAIFLVKFVLLSVPALFIIIGAPFMGWISDNWGRKGLLNTSLMILALRVCPVISPRASYLCLRDAPCSVSRSPVSKPRRSR